MDFNNHVVKVIHIFGAEVWITESMVNSWIICGVLILLASIVRYSILKPKQIPEGIQNAGELIVDFFGKFTTSTMGKHGSRFTNFYGPMFLFILFCNLSGLFLGPNPVASTPEVKQLPFTFMRPPTADIALTFSLAMLTFLMTQGLGIMSKGFLNWIKGFGQPFVLLAPLNIIGELANPISLSFRMFGNLLGGTIIMGLFYNLPWPALIGIPVALHIYFDVFAGVLQAFIFIMLSMTFVSGAME